MIATIIVPLTVPVAAYLLNSHAQREFEKRKTAYHGKLEAYKVMNAAMSRVFSNLVNLKAYLAPQWELETSEGLEDSLRQLFGILALAREDEREVGGSAIQETIGTYNKIVSDTAPESDKRSEALKEWALGAFLTLVLLRLRLIAHHADVFTRSYYDADILTDDDAVEKAAAALNSYLLNDLFQLSRHADKKMVGDDEAFQEFLKTFSRFDSLSRDLRDAMWDDLDRTL